VHTGYELEIRGGRHPVVETMMPREDFIPNDVALGDDARVMILTGPNMAGKSTAIRSLAASVILAQIGSYVPASYARIPICDRVFTRVGASDNLARGQSTFMVEMTETASILNAATDRSLVLLDEIGRGTSTYDGVSIAWAVAEDLHDRVGCKAIFATHYHELTQLADLLPAVVNYNVAVKESGEDIVFLHKLLSGPADRSYGVQVARLAGLPPRVVARARALLQELESSHVAAGDRAHQKAGRPDSTQHEEQIPLFPSHPSAVANTLAEINPDEITPLQAIQLLAELKKML
jgi:DNA mismatch repair protein MutS